MANEEGKETDYAALFFNSLCLCINGIDGKGDDKENIGNEVDRIFNDLHKKFSESEDKDKIPWDMMWHHIINSRTFQVMTMPEEAEEAESEASGESNTSEPEIYVWGETIADRLIRLDKNSTTRRFTWILQSKYYGLDLARKDENIRENLKDNLEKNLKKIDEDEKIKALLCYVKGGQVRERWLLNCIDAKAFYEELSNMPLEKQNIVGIEGEIFNKYCKVGAYETYRQKTEKLVDILKKIDEGNTSYMKLSQFTSATEIICELIPVVKFSDSGNRIKGYDEWREECRIVEKIVERKLSDIVHDMYKKETMDAVCGFLDGITDSKYDTTYEKILKDWYVDLVIGLNDYADKKLRKVIWLLDNTEIESDRKVYLKELLRHIE